MRLQGGNQEKRITLAVHILEGLPLWYGLWEPTLPDATQREMSIIAGMSRLSEFDTATLRRAEAQYQRAHKDDILSWSKLFVLNRYLFRIPIGAKDPVHVSGGFTIRSVNGRFLTPMSPLYYESSGRLGFDSVSNSYSGLGYEALDEFDYFQKHYGRRRKN